MDIRHEMGGNMYIVLDAEDIDRLHRHASCESQVVAEGAVLRTRIQRDEFTTEPIAETDGHNVDIYLPERVTLPVEAPVCTISPAANYYFGKAGRVCLTGQITLE